MNPKYLIYSLLAGLVILGGSDTNITKAAGSTATQRITITVPPMRILYVDAENRIVSILSNTAVISDERLQAFKAGAEIAVSDEIRSQYEKLSSIVDYGKIGWVYQGRNFEVELSKKIKPENQTDSEVEAYLDKSSCEQQVAEEIIISSEDVIDRVSEMNTLPLPPHKGNYGIRVTVYDAEDGLTGVSSEYFPQS